MTNPNMRRSCCGFTLIELSIVLVIIGLIVGGVLVGQDLIQAAAVRSQVAQLDSYEAAVHTFRIKYNGIPGDFASNKAASFGMQARSGANGHGDGDGVLEFCTPGVFNNYAGCENVLFWRDLSFASLIDGSFTTGTDAVATMTTAQVPSYLPRAKIGNENSILILHYDAFFPAFPVQDYYVVTGVTSTDGVGNYALVNRITPDQAYRIDVKMDDGLGGLGIIIGRSGSDFNAANGLCNLYVAPFTYNLATTSPSCQLLVKLK
jgi:prepilin-type N-terminal cleavage/methylation domain-containing protein